MSGEFQESNSMQVGRQINDYSKIFALPEKWKYTNSYQTSISKDFIQNLHDNPKRIVKRCVK